MTSWKPRIEVAIPEDIAVEEHERIKGVIGEVNDRIAKQTMLRKDAAIEIAAMALSKSGVGACGYPTAERGR